MIMKEHKEMIDKMIEEENEFDVQKAIKAQKRYCEEKEKPLFAPPDGICRNCKTNIYVKEVYPCGWSTGYNVGAASNTYITSCPHCRKSWCD